MANQKLKLQDIADICGVSSATVSRIINQHGRYSAETEKLVLETIRKYDFVPNRLAKGLKARRTNIIGVIIPDISNEFFAKMVLTIQNYLFEQQYSVLLCNTNESLEIEQKCIHDLSGQYVSGYPCTKGYQPTHGLFPPDVSIAFVDRYPKHLNAGKKNVAYVSSDNERGGYLAAKELIDSGCRNLVMISGIANSSVTERRTAGFMSACAEYGVLFGHEQIYTPEVINYQEGGRVMREIIDSGREFDGVFCQTDWLASGAQAALIEAGFSIPEQVKLVGFDDISIASFCRNPFTTIHQYSDKIGTAACKLILDMISDMTPENRNILIPVTLVKRGTTTGAGRG